MGIWVPFPSLFLPLMTDCLHWVLAKFYKGKEKVRWVRCLGLFPLVLESLLSRSCTTSQIKITPLSGITLLKAKDMCLFTPWILLDFHKHNHPSLVCTSQTELLLLATCSVYAFWIVHEYQKQTYVLRYILRNWPWAGLLSWSLLNAIIWSEYVWSGIRPWIIALVALFWRVNWLVFPPAMKQKDVR